MCTEFPLGVKDGRRPPCDRGCRLGWRAKDKVLHVWRSVGNRSVLHSSTSVRDTGTLENVADMLTKHVPRAVLDKLAGMMGLHIS